MLFEESNLLSARTERESDPIAVISRQHRLQTASVHPGGVEPAVNRL